MIVHVAFRTFFANIFVSDLLVNQMLRMPSVAFVTTPCRSNGMMGHRIRVRVGVRLGLMLRVPVTHYNLWMAWPWSR